MMSEKHKPIFIMSVCKTTITKELLAPTTDQHCVSLPIVFERLTPNGRGATFKPSGGLFWFHLDLPKRLETN